MNSTQMLKSFRGKKLKTQNDLAQELQVSRQIYCGYENNPLQCPLDVLYKILFILDVTDKDLDDFLNAVKQDYLSYKNLLVQELNELSDELDKDEG